MSSYTTEHASALADVGAAGASVTFTSASAGTYSPTAGTWSSAATSTVTGQAVRVKGDPKVYAGLELVESDAPTLLVVPTTYGQVPALGSKVTWNSTVYTVKHVQVVAPNGSAILSRVVVAV